MINVAICDDDVLFLKNIKKMIEDSFQEAGMSIKVETYTLGKLLLAHHAQVPFDVIFLDIDMPDETGFEIAEMLNEQAQKSYIIFITSHSELIYDSFLFRPLNFITKSDNIENRLAPVINQLLEQMKQDRLVTLEDKEKNKLIISMKEILYIESNAHYADYHINGNPTPIHVRANISNLENEYKAYDFIRIQRKLIVNLRHVFNINIKKGTISLKQGIELPVSRELKNEIDRILTDYLRRIK